MKMKDLVAASQKPPVYTPGTAVMWTDTHISKQLLQTHLSQDTDLASRRISAIEKTISWMLDRLPDRPLKILDLGCGPGLYTKRLASRGHHVTGMDFSATAIAHAKDTAREKGLDIRYLEQDYLCLDHENQYDLVMMIFTDFGVLTPEAQCRMLENVHKALVPGGVFIFDVMNTGWVRKDSRAASWEAFDAGFWRPHPHLVLSSWFDYPSRNVFLDQHIVVEDPTGDNLTGVSVYRFYTRVFSHGELEALVIDHGFGRVDCRDGILPDSDLYQSKDVTFCVAQK